MERSEYAKIIQQMRDKGITFENGLTDPEIESLEAMFSITFPDDLKGFLNTELPVGPGFPEWRRAFNDEEYRDLLNRWLASPIEGVLSDVENNVFWFPAWPDRPEDMDEALKIARSELSKVPKLIPVYSHRFMLNTRESGYPVISVHQTDIIYYGKDLLNYLTTEFIKRLKQPDYEEVKEIPFWSYVIEHWQEF